MKKILLSCLLVIGSLTAYDSCCCDDNCLPPLENDENLFPRCKSCFGNIEFLYWTVKEGALDYAYKGCCERNSDNFQFLPCGCVKNGHFDARPGVRVSIGYYNAPKYWEVVGEYTYFKTHGGDCTTGPSDENCYLESTFTLIGNPNDEFTIDFARCCTDFKYQLADFFATRVFDPNPHLRMRFLAGLSAAYLKHCFETEYLDQENTFSLCLQDHWNYKAGGLRLGVTADWWWCSGLYLTGKATLAGYMGKYKNYFSECNQFESLGFLCYRDTRFAEHIQLLVGPSWQHVGECFYYSLLVGYELNGWFNLQEMPKAFANPSNNFKPLTWNTSALALHGLTIRLNGGF